MNAVAARSRDEKHQRRIHTNSASRVLSPRSPLFSQKSQSRFHGVLRPSALKQIFESIQLSAERDWVAHQNSRSRDAPEIVLTKVTLRASSNKRRRTRREIPVAWNFFSRIKDRTI